MYIYGNTPGMRGRRILCYFYLGMSCTNAVFRLEKESRTVEPEYRISCFQVGDQPLSWRALVHIHLALPSQRYITSKNQLLSER